MTGEELSALIKDEIGEDARLHTILDRIREGKATFTDSELYAAITARIAAQQMQRNVLSLEKREAAFVGITHERYTDTFTVFSAVQRILDAENGIHIRPKEPGFDTGRARKIGHSLEDQTVPDSTIERRARSATENFCMSHHDDCMRANAEFRARAGLQSYAIRDGSAKCCDWCADVSGKYPANETPAGFWGRHDNCKCSILYESKRGGRQLLRGAKDNTRRWEVVPENAGAEPLVRLTHEQSKKLQAEKQLSYLTNGVRHGILNTEEKQFLDRIIADPDMSPEYRQILMDRFCSGSAIAQRAFTKIIPPDSVSVKDDPRDAYYTHKTKVVMNYKTDEVSWKRNGSTWFHEHGHMLDDIAGKLSASHPEYYEALRTDFAKFISRRTGSKQQLSYFDAIELLRLRSGLQEQLSVELGRDATDFETPKRLSSISDMIEGISMAMIRGCSGHAEDDPEYWNGTSIPNESFAHMFEAQFDKEHYQIIQQLFPTALSCFESMLQEVIT